jgi:hypothetical protein
LIVFLAGFTLFNACLGLAAAAQARALSTPEGKAWWKSRRLYAIASFAAWTLPLVSIGAIGAAWLLPAELAAAAVLAPLAWLIGLGALFAVVDFAEDGMLDFGRGPPSKL